MKTSPGAALSLYPLCIYVVVSTAAYIHRLPSDNEHDIQQNTALAIVRTCVPRETPLALKLFANPVVESERVLPLLLGLTHRPSIFAFSCLPNHHLNALCSHFFSCRFKKFSPETLVTFLLHLFSHQISLYAFITFLCLA